MAPLLLAGVVCPSFASPIVRPRRHNGQPAGIHASAGRGLGAEGLHRARPGDREDARDSDPQPATFVLVAAAIGARRSELVALRWGDFDLDQGTVVVSRGVEAAWATATPRLP